MSPMVLDGTVTFHASDLREYMDACTAYSGVGTAVFVRLAVDWYISELGAGHTFAEVPTVLSVENVAQRPEMQTFDLNLNDYQYGCIDTHAVRKHMSRAEFVRTAVIRYLDNQGAFAAAS